MVRCDALIVGGGPAGLAAAIALRQKGFDVLLADALRPPIDKACGEGLMPDARNDLAALGVRVNEPEGALFEGIAFFSGRHQASARFAHGSGLGLRRLQLHARLVERCERVGVRLAWGTSVRITPEAQFFLDGEPCVHRFAVGADGQASRVRRVLGLGEGEVLSRRFGMRRHYQLRPWSRMVEVHWGALGQAYVTPVGPEEIGVATVARSSSHRMDEVLAGLPGLQQRLQGARVVSRTRGALTTTRRLRRVTAGSTALIGDASGSVDAVTGEGIALSFRQALLLAEAMAADNLPLYEQSHPTVMRIPHIMSKAMLMMDGSPWLREHATALLAGQPQLFARLLAVHLGEQSLTRFFRDLPSMGLRILRPTEAVPTRIC